MTLSWAGGFVVISLCRKPEGRSPPPPLGELSTISDPGSEEQVVPPSTLHPLNAVEVPTKDVSAAVEHARGATVELKGYNGTALDSATVVASSNLFEIVIGYVDKVVQFGDIISQVLLTLRASFTRAYNGMTFSGPSVCQSGMGCIDSRSQGLNRRLSNAIVGPDIVSSHFEDFKGSTRSRRQNKRSLIDHR
jgi:hypothetical protein